MKLDISKIGLFIIPAFLFLNSKDHTHAKLDMEWKIISKTDSNLKIEFLIRSNKIGERICNANFEFHYNDKQMEFARKNSVGIKNVDYYWSNGFEPCDTIHCTVTKPTFGNISVNIFFKTGIGLPIYSESNYIPVVDLVFKLLKTNEVAKINFVRIEKTPPTFDNIFGYNQIAFDEGIGWDKPLTISL